MESCIFCKIIDDHSLGNIIFENDMILGIVPLEQVSKGHILLIPKEHFENIFDISESILKDLIAVAKEMSREVLTQGATGINLLHASGKDAQQSVFHFHLHVVPRYPNDGLDLWVRNNL